MNELAPLAVPSISATTLKAIEPMRRLDIPVARHSDLGIRTARSRLDTLATPVEILNPNDQGIPR